MFPFKIWIRIKCPKYWKGFFLFLQKMGFKMSYNLFSIQDFFGVCVDGGTFGKMSKSSSKTILRILHGPFLGWLLVGPALPRSGPSPKYRVADVWTPYHRHHSQ